MRPIMNLHSLFGKNKKNDKQNRRPRHLVFEPLADRQMMAANIFAELNNGVLRVEGTDRADQIVISEQAGQLTVQGVDILVGGQPVAAVNVADVNSIEVSGLGDDDLIDLNGDEAAGTSPVNAPATILGGDGNDTLIGGSGGDTIEGGEGDDSLFGKLGANVLRGGSGTNQLFDQHDQAVLRPTLVVVTHGGWANRGQGEDAFAGYARHIRDALKSRGSDAVVWQIDWDSKQANERPTSDLADEIDDFLSKQTETWDVLFFGHSRGGIFQHKVSEKLEPSNQLGTVYQIAIDPTAVPIWQDRFPKATREGTYVSQYDDNYQLFPTMIDGRKLEGIDDEEYHNVHEEMQRDIPKGEGNADTQAAYALGELLASQDWRLQLSKVAVDNIYYHTEISDWYLYGTDDVGGADGHHFEADLARFIGLKTNGNDFDTAVSAIEMHYLDSDESTLSFEDLLLADLHGRRYGGGIWISFVENKVESYKNSYFDLARDAFLAVCPSAADKAVVRAFCDAVQERIDKFFADSTDRRDAQYQRAEEFLTGVLSPLANALGDLLVDAYGSMKEAITNPGHASGTIHLGDLAPRLIEFVQNCTGLEDQIEKWAEEAKTQVDQWLQEQSQVIDNWALGKAETAIGFVTSQAAELERWLAGQLSSISRQSLDTVSGIRNSANKQVERMRELGNKQLDRIEAWIDSSVRTLEQNLPTQARTLVREAVKQLERQADKLRSTVNSEVSRAQNSLLRAANELAARVEAQARALINDVSRAANLAIDRVEDQRDAARDLVAKLVLDAKTAITLQANAAFEQIEFVAENSQELTEVAILHHGELAGEALLANLASSHKAAIAGGANTANLDAKFSEGLQTLKQDVLTEVNAAKSTINNMTAKSRESINAAAQKFQRDATNAASNLGGKVQSAADAAKREMQKIVDKAKAEIVKIRNEIKRQAEAAAKAAREALERARNAAKKIVKRW